MTLTATTWSEYLRQLANRLDMQSSLGGRVDVVVGDARALRECADFLAAIEAPPSPIRERSLLGRDWIPVPPYVPDWHSVNGMVEWIAARLVEVERSVPSGDGQSIVQQIIDTELPMLRDMLDDAGVGRS